MGVEIAKIYPDFFDRFEMPEGAHDEGIKVYRACKNNCCDPESFLPTFVENGYKLIEGMDESDPGQYSLSTFEKPKEVKRFTMVRPDYPEPCKIAVGVTNPIHGKVQRTKERTGRKTSHVDWWLYKAARPYEEFTMIEDFKEYLENYNKENKKNEEFCKN